MITTDLAWRGVIVQPSAEDLARLEALAVEAVPPATLLRLWREQLAKPMVYLDLDLLIDLTPWGRSEFIAQIDLNQAGRW